MTYAMSHGTYTMRHVTCAVRHVILGVDLNDVIYALV